MSRKLQVVTVLNEKGGVGKTTVAVTVAAGLAARGRRVLLIDADAQGNATLALGLSKYPGLYDLLVRDAELTAVVRAIPREKFAPDGEGAGTLAVVGSNVETRSIAQLISDAWKLSQRLEALRDVFDVVIVDTAPTPSLLHGAIYLATDHLLYPTLLEQWSFDGLAESIGRLDVVQKHKPLKVSGIIPMRYRRVTLEHSDNLKYLREHFGALVWNAVPERIVWAEAATAQVPVFVHVPNSEAAGHAWELVDRVEEVIA